MKQLLKGWQMVKFGDVATELKAKVDRDNNPFERYIAGGDIDSESLTLKRWGTFGDDYVGPAFHRIFRKGQILYGSRRTYLKKVAVAHFDGVTANTTFVIEPRTDSFLVSGLLKYIMLSDGFTRHSIINSKGSTNPYILWSDIASYKFLLPPKNRQAEFLEVLEAAENAKNKIEALIESNQNLLKRYCSEIYRKGSFIVSKHPNSHWKRMKLGDLVSINYGKSPKDVLHSNGQYDVIGTGGVTGKASSFIVEG